MGGDGLVQKPHRFAAFFLQADKYWGYQNTTEILLFCNIVLPLTWVLIQERYWESCSSIMRQTARNAMSRYCLHVASIHLLLLIHFWPHECWSASFTELLKLIHQFCNLAFARRADMGGVRRLLRVGGKMCAKPTTHALRQLDEHLSFFFFVMAPPEIARACPTTVANTSSKWYDGVITYNNRRQLEVTS